MVAMGCDAPRTLKIAAKWSISSHRVAGPHHCDGNKKYPKVLLSSHCSGTWCIMANASMWCSSTGSIKNGVLDISIESFTF